MKKKPTQVFSKKFLDNVASTYILTEKGIIFSVEGWAVVANDGYLRAETKKPKGVLGLVARRCIITIVEPKKKPKPKKK